MSENKTRLEILSTAPDRHYDHIWDTCCDHGKLGIKLLKKYPKSKVHFNDIVSHIIEKLSLKLKKHVPLDRYTLSALDARRIKINSDNTLVYICGIGGKMACEIVQELVRDNPYNFELILCSHYHQYELRESLRSLHFKLIRSELIVHQGQQYEMLYISKDRGTLIPKYSEELYDPSCSKSIDYFKKSTNHFKKSSNHSALSKKIFNFYYKLLGL